MARPFRIGIVQQGPVFFDLEASLERLESWLQKATAKQLDLLVVGECWLSGYPAFLDLMSSVAQWDYPPMKQVFARMHANALEVGSSEFVRIQQAVRAAQLTLVIGANERVSAGYGNGTLFNALMTFAPDGVLSVHHRKLVPTYTERMVHGTGDAAQLRAAEIGGVRIGGLICWEHWMPLARHTLHHSGEHIHVALWPTAHEMHQVASRAYAFEGRCVVVAAGQVLTAGELPAELERPSGLSADALVLRGGSAVIGPDGRYLLEPVYDRPDLLVAEVDLDAVVGERMTLDVSGHYSRPDIFSVQVNRARPQ